MSTDSYNKKVICTKNNNKKSTHEMKTTKIVVSTVVSTFICLAINVNSFATDASDRIINSIEANKQSITSTLINNGRNNHLRFNQENIVVQLSDVQNAEDVVKINQPKGRNLEALDRIEVDGSSYAKAGRNKSTMNEMISMN